MSAPSVQEAVEKLRGAVEQIGMEMGSEVAWSTDRALYILGHSLAAILRDEVVSALEGVAKLPDACNCTICIGKRVEQEWRTLRQTGRLGLSCGGRSASGTSPSRVAGTSVEGSMTSSSAREKGGVQARVRAAIGEARVEGSRSDPGGTAFVMVDYEALVKALAERVAEWCALQRGIPPREPR